MLTGHKDPGTIASEVKMMRMDHAGAFLVVEGVADMRFWQPRRCEECELVNGEARTTLSVVFDGSTWRASTEYWELWTMTVTA